MIGRLSGTLVEKNPPQILLDVQGVAYEVDVPMSTFYNLPILGERVTLFTHLVVREDAHLLFGFGSESERRAFRQLIKISGVGARTALSVLSGLSVAELAQAVTMQDTGRLTKIPGIGKKTAERLLLELKDKLGGEVASVVGVHRPPPVAADVLNALLALGYSDKEAVRAVKQLSEGVAVADGIAALLTTLEPHDVLFIDEIHRLSPVVEEILYPALEDFKIDIMIGEGPAARSVKLDLQPFTLVGATTRAGMLTNPLRDRFGIVARLEFYTAEELTRIVTRSAKLLDIALDPAGALEIAQRSRGTPRIVNRLLRRVRDYAEVRAAGRITHEVADAALSMLDVDVLGLDVMDRKLLRCVLDKFAGGPVGIDNLSAAIGEERDTIEDVLEPFLIQQGFLQRTSRGRIATALSYRHFGLVPPAAAGELFASE